jgi:hypothetical protein
MFAAAEHRRHSFLRPQLLLAAAPARGAGGDVDLARFVEAADRGLLAAAVADQDPLGTLGGELAARAGVGAGDRLRVQGAVEQLQPFVDEDVDGVLGLAGLLQPAGRLGLLGERGEGADRGRPGQRQRSVLAVSLSPLRPPAAAGGAPVRCRTRTLSSASGPRARAR